MSAIERMKQHFADLGVQTVEVPEWGEDGKPLVIYFRPVTLEDMQRYEQAREREGRIAALADALVMRALDAEGKKMFTIEHKRDLRKNVDPRILARVIAQMNQGPGVEEMGNA